MNNFQELQKKHLDLLRRYETNKESAEFIKDVREYVEQVISGSREIGDSRERNQLRANLRFWGAYIYDHTGTYPNLSLLPSEGGSLPSKPETRTLNRSWILIASLFLIMFIFLGIWIIWPGRGQPNSQGPGMTNTPLATDLFSTPIGQTPFISMSDVANFGTSTAVMALTQSLNPATTLTPGTALTEMAVPTPTFIIPNTGGGEIPGHASSSIEIQDDSVCSNHRVNIKMVHDFAANKSVEPAILTVSEEGTFRKVLERQFSLNEGGNPSNSTEAITTEIIISNARGSYLIYIDHPKFTFDSVIVQHLPDCQGNLTVITYEIPNEDYDELESRPSLGVNFGLVAWGPYPVTDPESIQEGVAKIHLSSTGSIADTIFWIAEESGDFESLQNDEFIAYRSLNYLIGVTSGGRTISIPFRFETPYLDYLQNK